MNKNAELPLPDTHRRVFTVSYADLTRWSVNSFAQSSWRWPPSVLRPFRDVAKRRIEKVRSDENSRYSTPLGSIHFDGKISVRPATSKQVVKGRLFRAEAGDVVYSKIDARNGAVGVVQKSSGALGFSTEYPIYSVNQRILDPDFLRLVLRSSHFRYILNSMASGTSGRKRIQPSDLEATLLPIPSIHLQRRVVAIAEKSRRLFSSLRDKAVAVERDASAAFLETLGLNAEVAPLMPRSFVLDWRKLARWGVTMSWHDNYRHSTAKFPQLRLGQLCRTGTGGTPNRSRNEYFGGGIHWVKTTDVCNNTILITEETLTELGLQNCQAKIYDPGSLVMAMYGQGATRGRISKLGIHAATNQACLVMYDIDSALDPDYLWYYLLMRYDALRSLASGNNQPNLSAELVRSFPICVPPRPIQDHLVIIISDSRRKSNELRLDASAIERRSEVEIEELIVGVKQP